MRVRPAKELLDELEAETRVVFQRFMDKAEWAHRCLGWSHYVVRFLHFSQSCGRSFKQVDLDFVNDYLLDFFDRYPRRSTRNHLVRALKKWLGFLYAQERCLLQPLHQQMEVSIGGSRKLRHALSLAQVREILDAPDLSNACGIRTKACWELAYACALRASELVALRVADIDFCDAFLTVRTSKNQRGRVLPIPSGCLAWLKHYLLEARPQLLRSWSNDEVFLTSRGRAFPAGKLLRALKEHHRYPIHFRYCLHQMRHSCASHLLDAGVPVGSIRHFLGHETLKSTQIYTHCQQSWLREVYDLSHPRA